MQSKVLPRGLTTRYLERDLVYGLPGGGSSLAPPLFSTSRSLTFLSCHGLCIVPRIRRYADNLTQSQRLRRVLFVYFCACLNGWSPMNRNCLVHGHSQRSAEAAVVQRNIFNPALQIARRNALFQTAVFRARIATN